MEFILKGLLREWKGKERIQKSIAVEARRYTAWRNLCSKCLPFPALCVRAGNSENGTRVSFQSTGFLIVCGGLTFGNIAYVFKILGDKPLKSEIQKIILN